MKVQRAIAVILVSAVTRVSHFKVLCQSFFYVMGKALSYELSCTRTGLVIHRVTKSLQKIKSSEVDRAHDKLFICLTDVRHRYRGSYTSGHFI